MVVSGYLVGSKKAGFSKRTLIVSGGIIALLLIMGVIYQKYLAPDPQVTARYGFEQSAQDFVINGNYEEAMKEVDQGLKIAPQDPSLLTLKVFFRKILDMRIRRR